MSKQWWECEPKFNDKGNVIYNDDCVITIVKLGEVKEYTNRDFQSISVLGQQGVTIDNFSLSYGKQENKLTPDDMNKPLVCRIKVENDTGQYGINGHKYTAMIGEKKKSSGGGGGSRSGGGYRKDSPEEILGKCETLFIEATLASAEFTPTTLAGNELQLKGIADLAKWVNRTR